MLSQTGREGRRHATKTCCAKERFSNGGCRRATGLDLRTSSIAYPLLRIDSPSSTSRKAPPSAPLFVPPSYYRRLSARPQSSPANRLSLFCLALPLLVLLAHPPCAHSARSPEATHTALPGATQSAPPARSASAVPPQLRNLLGAFRRCQPSSLPGFTTSKSFYGGLTLHWAATTGSTLRLALQAKAGSVSAKSWFAIGWTPDGQMSGSDAVVRVPSSNTPGRFFLDGYSNVHATTSFAIGSPSIETTSSHGTVMKFSRSSGDGGEVAVKPRGRSQMVWAYGADAWSTTAQHDARGTTSIDFSCNGCWVLFFKVC